MPTSTPGRAVDTAPAGPVAAPAGPPTEAGRRALWPLGLLGPAGTAAMPPHAWRRLRFARWRYATGQLREEGEGRQASRR